MARFLFVVPPLTGHTNPTVPVAATLAQRGHEVAWAGEPPTMATLLPGDAVVFPAPAELPSVIADAIRERGQALRGAAALKFLWEGVLHPLALSMVEPVDDAVDRFDPDVLVVDQQTVAGAVVARRRNLVWATSATTSAEFADPLEGLPRIAEWVTESLVQVQLELGVDEVDAREGDLRFSDHLVLAFTTTALTGPLGDVPDHYRFVGPSIDTRPRPVEFPWDWIDPAVPLVVVSLGTVNQLVGERFYREAVAALAALDVQGVVVAPPEMLGEVPDNVLVRSYVPQLDLLPHADLVVSHGGHNTVCEALANGIPMVLAPIRDDQPVVAEQVVAAGAGVRVKFGRVRAEALRDRIAEMLDSAEHRAAAARVRDSFDRAGGPAMAADELERIA